MRDERFVRPVETVRCESLGIEESVPQIVETGNFPGVDDLLGEIVVGKVLLVLNVGATRCLLGGYLGLIEVLKRVVVSRLVLSGEYREKRRQKHAFEKEDGEEDGNEECRMSDDLHDWSIFKSKNVFEERFNESILQTP